MSGAITGGEILKTLSFFTVEIIFSLIFLYRVCASNRETVVAFPSWGDAISLEKGGGSGTPRIVQHIHNFSYCTRAVECGTFYNHTHSNFRTMARTWEGSSVFVSRKLH